MKFPVCALRLVMGTVRENPLMSTAVALKGRINESLVTKGVHAMRRNHIPQEPDWTYPSSLNESFSEFHPISSV